MSYGPVQKTSVEGHKKQVLSRNFYVKQGPSYEASRLLREAGLYVQPKVIHPNGSGGREGYVLVDSASQKLPKRWKL